MVQCEPLIPPISHQDVTEVHRAARENLHISYTSISNIHMHTRKPISDMLSKSLED